MLYYIIYVILYYIFYIIYIILYTILYIIYFILYIVSVPGRPVISNCGAPTEKASEFLDHHLQPIMGSGMS